MQKVIISQAGQIGVIVGPGAKNSRLTWITPDGFDPTVEEFEVNCTPEQLKKLRKMRSPKECRKFRTRKLYRRGENPELDKQRDAVDLA